MSNAAILFGTSRRLSMCLCPFCGSTRYLAFYRAEELAAAWPASSACEASRFFFRTFSVGVRFRAMFLLLLLRRLGEGDRSSELASSVFTSAGIAVYLMPSSLPLGLQMLRGYPLHPPSLAFLQLQVLRRYPLHQPLQVLRGYPLHHPFSSIAGVALLSTDATPTIIAVIPARCGMSLLPAAPVELPAVELPATLGVIPPYLCS